MNAKLIGITMLGMAAIASAGSLRSEMDSMNKVVSGYIMKKDVDGFVKAVKARITPDFKYMESGKVMDFDTMAQGMKMGLGMYTKITNVSTKTISVKEKGDSAQSVTSHMITGLTMGKDKKSHKMVMSGTSTDTYKKVKGKWMMSMMNWTSSKVTMDGKAMDMSKMGG